MIHPPRWATRILTRALQGDPATRTILGDLHEDFVRLSESRGRTAARLWYWRESFAFMVGRFAHRLVPALARASLPWPKGLAEDAVHAARVVRRSPGFSLFPIFSWGPVS